MSDTQAWIIVAAMFAITYLAGLFTVPLARQILGHWPPLLWTRIRSLR